MTDYTRRKVLGFLGSGLAASAGCTAPTNNDMDDVDQALEEGCETTDIKTGEKSTITINSSEYTLEGAGVYNDKNEKDENDNYKAALKINGNLESLGEGEKVHLDNETAYITKVFKTGEGEGVVEVSYGECDLEPECETFAVETGEVTEVDDRFLKGEAVIGDGQDGHSMILDEYTENPETGAERDSRYLLDESGVDTMPWNAQDIIQTSHEKQEGVAIVYSSDCE